MSKDLETVFADYMKERNSIPRYAEILGREKPDFLVRWFDTRRSFMTEGGALENKYKEIILAANASVCLYQSGADSHVRTAIKAGATKEQLIEAALCVWLTAGMTALATYLSAIDKAIVQNEGTAAAAGAA